MRVGIDGRVLLGRKTGDRTYTYNLVRALARADIGHEFVVYLDEQPPAAIRDALDGLLIHVRERPRGYLWTVMALPRLARADRLDLLHVQYMAPFVSPCPVISTIHDISFKLYPQWFTWRDRVVMNRFLPGSLRRTASVLAPSEATASDIAAQYSYPRERIFVTPEASGEQFLTQPDAADRARIRAKFQMPGPYMLYVGNLQPRKNVRRLIRAFVAARTQKRFAEQLILAGQPAWKCAEEQRLLHDAAAAGHVRHIGYVEDNDLPALYAEATALLFPTLYEGFGLPVLEAMAVGTPVLTSNVSSLPEVAGDAALLVDPRNEAAIGAAVAQLAYDVELRERLGAAGRNRAQLFAWSTTAELTIAAYEQTVGRVGQ